MQSNDAENTLVVMTQAGLPYDTRHYEKLVKPYVPALRAYCSRLLQNPQEGEDATQEVLIKVLMKLKSFRLQHSFRAWIYTIAHNECIDRIRQMRQHLDLDAVPEIPIDDSITPHQQIDELFKAILPTLSVIDRDILLLRHTVGLDFAEIAETTDMNLSAVKMRYKRCIEQIKSNLVSTP